MKSASMMLFLAAGMASAATLTWNGASGDPWDSSTQDWLDEASSPAAWADGSVAMFKTAGAVSVGAAVQTPRLAIAADAGAVSFSGGVITADAIAAGNVSTRFSSALAATNGMSVAAGGGVFFGGFLTAADQTVFPNLSLSDITGLAGYISGAYITHKKARTAFRVVNGGTTLTAQFQTYEDGGPGNQWTKCVLVQLAQSGKGITGKVLGTRYIAGNQEGIDFTDTAANPGIGESGIATAEAAGGYGVCRIMALTGSAALGQAVELAGAVAPAGELAISGGVQVDGTVTNDILNSGTLYANSNGCSYFGSITGSGAVVVPGAGTGTERAADTAGYVTMDAAVSFTGLRLSDVTSVHGYMNGGYISKDLPDRTTTPCFMRRTGDTLRVQMQFADDFNEQYYLKVVTLELAQSGNDVTARAIGEAYIESTPATVAGDYDFDNMALGTSIATTDDTGIYGIKRLSVTLGGTGIATFSGPASSYTGQTVVDGTAVVTHARGVSPDTAAIFVNEGATLIGEAQMDNVGSSLGGTAPLTVKAGGKFIIKSKFNAGFARLITLDGSEMRCNAVDGGNIPADGGQYVCNLLLKNGASLTGNAYRMGYLSDAQVKVGGTSASAIRSGLVFVNAPDSTQSATFDVDDVTGDSLPDLTVSGMVRDYTPLSTADPNDYHGMTLLKQGAGTMSLCASNTFVGAVTVAAGTLSLDAPAALTSNNVTLASGAVLAVTSTGATAGSIAATGGTLSVNAAGFKAGNVSFAGGTLSAGAAGMAAGTFTLAGDMTLALGDDATVAFADSSAAVWAAGAALTITGELGKAKVRFGTDANGLTAAQLGQINYGGHRVMIDAGGYLHEAPKGIVLQMK
jgi:autotransporter-associated beta strand protein